MLIFGDNLARDVNSERPLNLISGEKSTLLLITRVKVLMLRNILHNMLTFGLNVSRDWPTIWGGESFLALLGFYSKKAFCKKHLKMLRHADVSA